jgi:hypothetical protein
MMGTTHAAMGLALAYPLVRVAPEWAPAVAVAALVGSLLPDVDLFVGEHRRTLHFPVGYWPLAFVATALFAFAPRAGTLAVAVALYAAALHAVTDALGGQTGGAVWEGDGHRGVYAHALGTWLRPRRWIRYDGAPEDLALCVLVGAPAVYLFEGPIRWLAVGGLAVSAVYVAVRKRLPRRASDVERALDDLFDGPPDPPTSDSD